MGHNDIEMMNVALEALINIAENYKNESNDSQSNNVTLENLFTEIETGIFVTKENLTDKICLKIKCFFNNS